MTYIIQRKSEGKWITTHMGYFNTKQQAWKEISKDRKGMLENPLTDKKVIREMFKKTNFKIVKKAT
jgi:hypothetical protein